MWLDPRTMGVFHFSLATIHSPSLSNTTTILKTTQLVLPNHFSTQESWPKFAISILEEDGIKKSWTQGVPLGTCRDKSQTIFFSVKNWGVQVVSGCYNLGTMNKKYWENDFVLGICTFLLKTDWVALCFIAII
jgi:hypothetical protein